MMSRSLSPSTRTIGSLEGALIPLDSDQYSRIGYDLSMLAMMAPSRRIGRKGLRRPRSRELDALEGNEYLVFPIPDGVVFPNLVMPIFVPRERSARVAEEAEANDTPLLVVAQRDPDVGHPDIADLYSIGTSVEIGARAADARRQHYRAGAGHRTGAHHRGDRNRAVPARPRRAAYTRMSATTWRAKR